MENDAAEALRVGYDALGEDDYDSSDEDVHYLDIGHLPVREPVDDPEGDADYVRQVLGQYGEEPGQQDADEGADVNEEPEDVGPEGGGYVPLEEEQPPPPPDPDEEPEDEPLPAPPLEGGDDLEFRFNPVGDDLRERLRIAGGAGRDIEADVERIMSGLRDAAYTNKFAIRWLTCALHYAYAASRHDVLGGAPLTDGRSHLDYYHAFCALLGADPDVPRDADADTGGFYTLVGNLTADSGLDLEEFYALVLQGLDRRPTRAPHSPTLFMAPLADLDSHNNREASAIIRRLQCYHILFNNIGAVRSFDTQVDIYVPMKNNAPDQTAPEPVVVLENGNIPPNLREHPNVREDRDTGVKRLPLYCVKRVSREVTSMLPFGMPATLAELVVDRGIAPDVNNAFISYCARLERLLMVGRDPTSLLVAPDWNSPGKALRTILERRIAKNSPLTLADLKDFERDYSLMP
jgi:hypothetical protein